MDWKAIGQRIAIAAPSVAALLGGPVAPAVGAILAATLGTGATPQGVATALDYHPEAMSKIMEIESNERIKLQELALQAVTSQTEADVKLAGLEVSDRSDARALAALQRDIVRPSITFFLLGGAILLIVAMFTFGRELIKDPTSSMIVGTIIGLWFNELKQATAFYFGGIRDVSRQQQATVTAELQAAIKKEKV